MSTLHISSDIKYRPHSSARVVACLLVYATCREGVYYVAPPPIRAAPGARGTCTTVLFGVLEAYPPLGTTPGVPGRELAAVCEIAINPLDAPLDTSYKLVARNCSFSKQLPKLTRLIL
jgi:hypothetical protein